MVVNRDNHSQREWNGLPIFQSKSPSLTAANSSAVRLDGFYDAVLEVQRQETLLGAVHP